MPRPFLYLLVAVVTAALPGLASAAKPPCSAEKVAELEGTDPTRRVNIDCDLTLDPGKTYYGELQLVGEDASGVTIDCQGSAIRGTNSWNTPVVAIRSEQSGSGTNATFERPENITIRNCTIHGNIRVWGMANGGSYGAAFESSHSVGHTQRARAAAPRNIVLDNLQIYPDGESALYVSIGVTGLSLLNSIIGGTSGSVVVYLDAESGHNVIKNNTFSSKTTKREIIAIDGSDHNRIIGNRFNHLANGGVYLYRNCGEDGAVRHNKPQHNQIINNRFYYVGYRGKNPAVYIAERDGGRDYGDPTTFDKPKYCGEDKDYPLESGISDLDYAYYNVVMQNQITKRSVAEMIRVRNAAWNKPNYIAHNEKVASFHSRKSGCFLPANLDDDFLEHGQSAKVVTGPSHAPSCAVMACVYGTLKKTANCGLTVENFGCEIEGNNAGCTDSAQCSGDTVPLGARAACNLEFGTVQGSALNAVRPGGIRVVKPSSNVAHGRCQVGTTKISERESIIRGPTSSPVVASCKEHDKNGGDCHVRAQLFCGSSTATAVPGNVKGFLQTGAVKGLFPTKSGKKSKKKSKKKANTKPKKKSKSKSSKSSKSKKKLPPPLFIPKQP